MNDSFGQGGFDTTTSEVNSETKSDGVLSVFVSQIKACTDDAMKFFGKTYGMICIVGLVNDVEHSSTKITYNIMDDTGSITTHLWIDDGDQITTDTIPIGKYARVYGSVRRQQDEKVIMIYKIEELESLNEITTHNLEVLLCRYQAERSVKKTNEVTGADFDFGNAGGNAAAEPTLGLNGKNLLIFQAVKAYRAPDGIERNVLRSKFSHITDNEFQTIISFLLDEGYIYSSIDADHFLPTE